MKRKGIGVVSALVLVMGLTACSGDSNTASSTGTKSEELVSEETTQEETTKEQPSASIETVADKDNIAGEETSYENIFEQAAAERETETEWVYIPGPEDKLATQRYEVGSEIKHEDKDGKDVIKYNVTAGKVPFDAGMMMFVNGIPQTFTDEEGNSTYVSKVSLKSYGKATEYYTCDFNCVEEAEKYICVEKNMLQPDIMVVKRKGFTMGHLHALSNGWAHEVKCDKFTDVDMGELEINEVGGCAEGSVLVEGKVGDKKSYGVPMLKSDATHVEVSFDSNCDGYRVITFWGNNVPVQVGEHMYYRVYAEKGKKYSYTFELDEELVNSIDNFFVTVAVLGDEPIDCDVYGTRTCIFIDEFEE